MIEATCSACGTLNRIAESDVPVGAKFVNCTSCKARVILPVKHAGTGKVPVVPPIPKAPPGIPKGPPSIPLGPAGAAAIVPPPAAGGTNDIIDLSDLPAPKRHSPLGAEPSRPAPRSALSSALEAELPVPRASRPPATSSGSLDLDDLMAPPEQPDLPAPRGARPSTPRTPEPAGFADLPAPKTRTPSPSSSPRTTPSGAPGISDLPAPRPGGARALTDLPMPADLAELPAPRARAAEIADLPAPRGKAADITDLPAPRGAARGAAPAMALPSTDGDLLTPKQSLDLPAPKGFFEDLPQPSRGGAGRDKTDDIAPKGFFDDLPQPAKGGGAPRDKADDIAPKGFFDDLPQPGRARPTSDVAPKGFFDDLPQKAKARPEVPEVPAPKGFFDDLPQPARARSDSKGPQGSISLDLGDDSLELATDDGPGLDLGPGLELDAGPAASGSFDQLDLSSPSTPPSARSQTPAPPPDDSLAGAIRFDKPKPGAGSTPVPKAPLPSIGAKAGGDLALELEEPRPGAGTQKLGPKPKERPVVDDRAARAKAKRKRTVIASAVLGVALLGSGGYYFYNKHAVAQERADAISEQIAVARKALVADDANHWQRAATAAGKVIELDPKHGAALGIGAEASIAGAMADGKNATQRITKGSRMISDALGAGITGPELERAQALSTLSSAPDKAVPRLQALLNRNPKDGLLALYLGWANAAAGDPPAALKAFDQAIASTPAVKILALLGRAKVNLSIADVDGARADYDAVLQLQKDNIPAQVGLASTLPQSQSQQQESDLLAILARKDIPTADPRAVVQAWVLAGDVARRGGRLDAARERYRKALAVEAKDVTAMTGLAEVELRDDKIDIALEHITKALTQSRDDVRAQLVASEIEIKKGKLDVAEKRVTALAGRNPPLPPLDLARLKLVTGRLLEKRGEHDAAVDAYVEAAKLSGDYDLTPTMAAVSKLSELARQAQEAKEVDREAALRARADQLLASLAVTAEKDLSLAFTLGVAYQQAGAPAKAEPLLRRVLAAREGDVDAMYQLGKVLTSLGRGAEALAQLEKAQAAAPARAEIGLELARTYEEIDRDDDAGKMYDRLLAEPEPSIELRGYAGKYFVRTKQMDKAGVQGESILEADKTHPAGHYLKGEGLLAAGKFDLARKEFTEAVSLERDPLYLDGQARATEQLSIQRNNDIGLQDAALRAYLAASELDPKLFNALLGQGRLYVARREMAKAVTPLVAATKLDASNAEVAFLLGAAYQGIGGKREKATAIGWLVRSSQLRARAETAYRLGQLYQDPEINQAGPAAAAYGNATRLAFEEMKKEGTPQPTWYADALFFYGRLSLDTGNESAAKKAWEQWLGLKPPPPPGARRSEVERTLNTSLRGVSGN